MHRTPGILSFDDEFPPAAREILTWSDECLGVARAHAQACLNRLPIQNADSARLRELRLLDETDLPTELGAWVGYHLLEQQWQQRDDPLRQALLVDGNLSPEATILDVGCGAGHTLHLLQEPEPALRVGVDKDAVSLALGARLYNRQQPTLSFVQGHAESLPFRDQSFSHAICRVSLNYVRQSRMLGEMVRIVKPGGTVAIRFEGAGYDLQQLRATRDLRGKLGKLRELASGMFYHYTGHQLPLGRLAGRRTFASHSRLRRTLTELGCEVASYAALNPTRLLQLPNQAIVVAKVRV